MPRPTSKTELQELGKQNYEKLLSFIDNMGEAEQLSEFPGGTMNRNIADVLMHLHHWHLMLQRWYTVGMKGEKSEMPATGYSWKTTPELNKWIWEKYAETDLSEAKTSLAESFRQIQTIIEKHSNEELFEKKRYKWTGTTSIGSYIVSATSSHYDWAFKLINKAKKNS